MLKYLLSITFLVLAIQSSAFPQKRKTAAHQISPKQAIESLLTSKDISGVFGDDGAGLFEDSREIDRVFALHARAFPYLISYLDDKRKMPHLGSNETDDGRVTLGDFCFDILARMIVHKAPLFDMKCEKEGPGDIEYNCLAEKYQKGASRKQNWQIAYRKNLLKYDTRNDYR